jgi:uncharacterized membrane protein
MTKNIAKTAIIAALYAALTLLLAPISYGTMQIRVSEALCVLALFTPAAVPGLTLGCLLANLIGPFGIHDVIFGTLATLVGVGGIWLLRKKPYAAPLCNVISNGLIVGFELWYFFGLEDHFWLAAAWVALGELIACYVLGVPLMKFLEKNHTKIGL